MVDQVRLYPSKTRVDNAGERLSGWMAGREYLSEAQLVEEVIVGFGVALGQGWGRQVDTDFAIRLRDLREEVRPYFVTNT